MMISIPEHVYAAAFAALFGSIDRPSAFRSSCGPYEIEFRSSTHADLKAVLVSWSSVVEGVRRVGTAHEIVLRAGQIAELRALCGITVRISSAAAFECFPLLESAKASDDCCVCTPSVRAAEQILKF